MLPEMWDTDVNEWAWVARVRRGGWDVSSLPAKVALEEDKLGHIYLDAPREHPTCSSHSHGTDPGPLLWGPHCC